MAQRGPDYILRGLPYASLQREGSMEGLLETRLHTALAQEADNTPLTSIYSEEGGSGSSDFVTSQGRDQMVQWLRLLTHDLHFCREVFFRATCLLDSFLSLLKVRHRFLECVTTTCFYIAVKLEEKPEAVSSLLDVLVEQYECSYSQTDIQRMELIIMQKLEFKLTSITPLDFLKIYHLTGLSDGTLVLPEGLSTETHLCHMTLCLEAIICNHHLMKFRSSLLALAVLACDLKLLGCDWLTPMLTLQTQAKIRGAELSVCYETTAPHYLAVAVQYPLAVASGKKRNDAGVSKYPSCRDASANTTIHKSTVNSPLKTIA